MIVTKINNSEIMIRLNEHEEKEIENIDKILEVDMVVVFAEALENALGYYGNGCQRVIDAVRAGIEQDIE